jgi:hypothetical protein
MGHRQIQRGKIEETDTNKGFMGHTQQIQIGNKIDRIQVLWGTIRYEKIKMLETDTNTIGIMVQLKRQTPPKQVLWGGTRYKKEVQLIKTGDSKKGIMGHRQIQRGTTEATKDTNTRITRHRQIQKGKIGRDRHRHRYYGADTDTKTRKNRLIETDRQ